MSTLISHIDLGIANGLISIDETSNKITYHNLRGGDKTIKGWKDPEEKVRADFFCQLCTTYQYEASDIALEVEMPKRVPNHFADLVIYQPDSQAIYFVVEFKKADISDNEFEQAVKQGIGNGRILDALYYGTIAGETQRFFERGKDNDIEDAFYSFPIRYGNPEERTYTKGGVKDIDPVTIDGLKTILNKAHQTIWKGGKRNPAEAFGEVAKIIFIKVADEKTARKQGSHYEFQRKRNESIAKLSARIHALYDTEKQKDKQVFDEPIKLDDKELTMVVEHLQGVNLNKTDLDVKALAFQQFLGNFFKGDFGQYFTPSHATRFCIDMLGDELKDHHKVLDPACGSGGFLLHVLDFMREQANEFFPDYKTDPQEAAKHFNYRHSFAENNLYGIEISESIARVAKMNMILHDDGHTNVICHDALDNIDDMHSKNLGFGSGQFDFIFTNPPFGATVKETESDYLGTYELGKNGKNKRNAQKTEILFLERCRQFLEPKGQMAVVLPDGILTNSSLQYVREWILDHFKLRAVVSLPQDAFRYYGAGVKSSILFLQKWGSKKEAGYKIFMASAEQIGIDATGRPCPSDLPGIVAQFREFTKNPLAFH